MNDKELKEWEEECKEADKDIKHIGTISFITVSIILLLYILSRYL